MNSFSKWRFALVLSFFTVGHLCAGELQPISLWPKGAPGARDPIGEEKDITKESDELIAGKRVIRLGNVSNPTITVYPPKSNNTGAGVVVCPGGGYHILAMDLEGTEVCEWLNSIGVTAILLKYRVPARKGQENYFAPLQDAQRALSLTRQRAEEWHLNPKRIGVLGFSAGGHLSAALSTNYEKREYEPVDAADSVNIRPDFVVLVYPGYLAAKGEGNQIRAELKVNGNTPPTFIVQTQDDGVGPENSINYYLALTRAKVPAELHLYPSGGHGYGLRKTEKAVTNWPRQVEGWMRGMAFLK